VNISRGESPREVLRRADSQLVRFLEAWASRGLADVLPSFVQRRQIQWIWVSAGDGAQEITEVIS